MPKEKKKKRNRASMMANRLIYTCSTDATYVRRFMSQLLCFPPNSLLMYLGEQWRMAQIPGHLPLRWERPVWHSQCLAQPLEGVNQQMEKPCLSKSNNKATPTNSGKFWIISTASRA